MKLSILIPAYNESGNIEALIQKLISLNYPSFIESHEIIIIDDGSTDDTFRVADGIAIHHKNILVIRSSGNMGKGYAIVTGMQACSGDIILIQDADMELSPDDISGLIAPFNNQDIFFVSGTRYRSAGHENFLVKKIANSFFSVLASQLSGQKITDLTCGYKVFRSSWIKQFQLREKGFGIETELYLKAIKFNKKGIVEIPVSYYPRTKKSGKKLRKRDGLYVLKAIFKYGI